MRSARALQVVNTTPCEGMAVCFPKEPDDDWWQAYIDCPHMPQGFAPQHGFDPYSLVLYSTRFDRGVPLRGPIMPAQTHKVGRKPLLPRRADWLDITGDQPRDGYMVTVANPDGPLHGIYIRGGHVLLSSPPLGRVVRARALRILSLHIPRMIAPNER